MTAPAASSRLGRLARRPPAVEAEPEHCDLCGTAIPEQHRHVLDVSTRDLRCACRACSLLFDRAAAADGRLRLVGDRLLALGDFVLDDLMWEELRLPVDVAFFFRSSTAERVMAFYPSPLGPTESLLSLDAWAALEAANPVLRTMADDVEALLVDRARGARRQWIVPIDECYSLVGLIRLHWRGLTGGSEVWRELARFFERLDERASTRRST
jgi:Family of unknown function (DUF5947)